MKSIKDIELPILIKKNESDVKKRGIGYCANCKTDVHGRGRIDRCHKCGQSLLWDQHLYVNEL